jgi:surfeit locus 1 family protein
VRTPAGEVRIEGIALEHLPRLLNVDPNAKGRVRQTLQLPAFAAETGLRLEPRVIEQHSPTDDGLLRDWPRPDTGVEKNESYALQWYSFAVLAVILGLVFSFRKN